VEQTVGFVQYRSSNLIAVGIDIDGRASAAGLIPRSTSARLSRSALDVLDISGGFEELAGGGDLAELGVVAAADAPMAGRSLFLPGRAWQCTVHMASYTEVQI